MPENDDVIESLAEAVPVAIVVLDPLGDPLYMNTAAVDLLGVDLAQLRVCGGVSPLAPIITERQTEPGVSSVEIEHGDRLAHVPSDVTVI